MVRTADLRQFGVTAHQWRRWEDEGRWLQVAPECFRHVATPLTFEMQVKAGAAWLGRRGALFGVSALAWLEILPTAPTVVEFLVPRSKRSLPNWLKVHTTSRWNAGDVITHRGVRTCAAARAIIDFAMQMPSANELETVIDRAVALHLTSLPTLRRRLTALSGSGRPGSRLLRELLLDSGGESHLERRFLRLVRVSGIRRPACQVVFTSTTKRVARVDFHFADERVVVEVSGRLGHVSDRDRQRDARRRNALQQAGETVLEFTTADVIDSPAYVLTTLRTSLKVAAGAAALRGQGRDANQRATGLGAARA